jgi:hypothetical protein
MASREFFIALTIGLKMEILPELLIPTQSPAEYVTTFA